MTDDRWQLESVYGGVGGDDYRAARQAIDERLERLEAFMAEAGVRGGDRLEVDAGVVAVVDRLLDETNELVRLLRTVSAYLGAFVSTDAFDETAQAEASSLRTRQARLGALQSALTAYLGRVDPSALLAASGPAAAHRHYVERSSRRARFQMGDEAESLAAELDASGGAAWERLYEDLIARGTILIHVPGREAPEHLGLPALVNLQSDPDRTVRGAAFRAELELLELHEVAYAAAMNGIKGQVGTLTARRSWPSAVAAATFEQGIEPSTLAAMQEAVEGTFETLRAFLRTKARLLGLPSLCWFDRRAPLPHATTARFEWAEGHAFVEERFAGFSTTLAEVARRAARERWVDVHPRAGKVAGAFCTSLPMARESRVLLNWGCTLDDVLMLAHELGHAYHNDCAFRFGRTSLQSRTPMTLAETASMFAETLVVESVLEQTDGPERLGILETTLVAATGVIVDIHSRFLFERDVFERRARRELSVSELDALMLDAQAATYGDGLDADGRFAKAWAEKPHYYSSGLSFYNFPYTFGYLFGLGLYARYRADETRFRARFDEFLASTGTDAVESLTRGMGCDVTDPAFWDEALGVVEARVHEYVRAAEVRA